MKGEDKRKKRKKSCKCKDATMRDQSKKKDKKKKKKKKKVDEQLQCAVLTQASVPDRSKNLLDPVAQAGNLKLKKRVAFDLSPYAVRIKRPKLSSSTPPCLTKSILVKSEAEEGPKQDNDSQDVNSQDLFITQKTFRTPSPELTKPAVSLSPRGRPKHPHLYKRTSRPKREAVAESSAPVCKMSSRRSPEVELNIVPPSLEAAKPKKQFHVVSRKTLTSTSTQTENFFTAELPSHHHSCRRRSAGAESPRPLDLSLPHRARAAACMSMDAQGKREEARHKSEMTPSLQSDSEPRSAETVTSGEENESLARAGGKLELAQVRQAAAVYALVTNHFSLPDLCPIHGPSTFYISQRCQILLLCAYGAVLSSVLTGTSISLKG